MNPAYGKLYLIPNTLGGAAVTDVIPEGTLQKIRGLSHFIAESEKSARQFLKSAQTPVPQSALQIAVIDKHAAAIPVREMMQPLYAGHDMGLLSDAGSPAVADPGNIFVRHAHANGIRVVPLTGPSSLLLALAASGLEGQRFCFHGYLAVERQERIAQIRQLEKESAARRQTQLFIETPYRNNALLSDLLSTCRNSTLLCIACDLTLGTEMVQTMSITLWKKSVPDLHKRPAVFLLLHQ